VALFFCAWTGLIAVRLGWLQVVRHSDFVHRAAMQQQRTFEVAPRRGMMYDRNLRELAVTVQADSVFAVPSELGNNRASAAEILAEIVRRIVTALHPERVILFGSYAYGKPSDHSDVDLLVILETDARPADRYLAVSRLIRPRPFPLDIVVKTPDEITQALVKGDNFISEIVTQGRVLYARSD